MYVLNFMSLIIEAWKNFSFTCKFTINREAGNERLNRYRTGKKVRHRTVCPLEDISLCRRASAPLSIQLLVFRNKFERENSNGP